MSRYLLAIDQGTTSSRAILYTTDLAVASQAQEEFPQYFPHNGWVEHNPEDIWQTVLRTCRSAIAQAQANPTEIACIGITNQRETVLVWDKVSGQPVCNAIVWQDRRTADSCQQLRTDGHEPAFRQATGLLVDPYFSGTKLQWILNNIPGARARAERGELLFGTVDTYLLWRLTGGREHATDATNAARTLMFNIHRQVWDADLVDILTVPELMLPEVKDSAADFGRCDSTWFGAEIPIGSMLGDQHAALVGQACFKPGMLKSTYGTGCFAVVNTGERALLSQHRLLTTVAYRLDGKVSYALEGSIFMAGAIVQWLRDGLGLIEQAADSEALAAAAAYDQSEIMVPAFTGLGAPYWDPDARAAIFGMTRNTGVRELVAAALHSVALQTEDLLQAMKQDGIDIHCLRVDGGMTRNRHFLQVLASFTGIAAVTSQTAEATAQGAAMLAGLQQGLFGSLDELASVWRKDSEFQPALTDLQRQEVHGRWLAAVAKVRST